MIRGDGENRRSGKNRSDPVSIEERETFPGISIYPAESGYIARAVTMAERIHLFSYRTQKLSSLTPKVLEDYPPEG